MVEQIRLMTTNLLNGRADVSYLESVLDRHEPDVVVTQELGFDAADLLAARYPNHYLNPSEEFKGRGIATRLDAEFGDIVMPARWGTSATLEVHGALWHLAGVHLLNPIDFPWWRSLRGRASQMNAVAGWARDLPGGPAILAGDFNATTSWPAYRRLVDGGWVDLVAEHGKTSGKSDKPTWAWRPGWPRVLRIDHVFGKGVRAGNTAVVPIVGSDHAAVMVDLTVS